MTNKLKNKLYIHFTKYADYVVCVSKIVYLNLYKKQVSNLIYIPNWANIEFHSAKRKLMNNGLYNILIASRLDKMKGHLVLFDACKNLNNIQIHVVGSGPSEKEFKEYSKNLNVVFYGYQKEVTPYYQSCNLLVHPSFSEGGNPLSILEGLAVGIPTIGSNIPAIREILEENYVFKKDSVTELRDKILYLKSNKENKQKNKLANNQFKYFEIIN